MPYRNSIITPEWIVKNLQSLLCEASGVSVNKINPATLLWVSNTMNVNNVDKLIKRIEQVFSVKLSPNNNFRYATVQMVLEHICAQYMERKLIRKSDLTVARQILHANTPYGIKIMKKRIGQKTK